MATIKIKKNNNGTNYLGIVKVGWISQYLKLFKKNKHNLRHPLKLKFSNINTCQYWLQIWPYVDKEVNGFMTNVQ